MIDFFPFLSCYVAVEKRTGISNPVKKRLLESYSHIFFTLATIYQIPVTPLSYTIDIIQH